MPVYEPPKDWSETEIVLQSYSPPTDFSETEISIQEEEDAVSSKPPSFVVGSGQDIQLVEQQVTVSIEVPVVYTGVSGFTASAPVVYGEKVEAAGSAGKKFVGAAGVSVKQRKKFSEELRVEAETDNEKLVKALSAL